MEPIACTLSESEMQDRVAWMRALGSRALVGVELNGNRATLRFAGEPEQVAELVEMECDCCAFLEFDVHTDGPATTVDVRTQEAAAPALREWVRVIAGNRIPA